jgi:hypothetical protein
VFAFGYFLGHVQNQLAVAFVGFAHQTPECAISDAISNAELILERIDEHWPTDVS